MEHSMTVTVNGTTGVSLIQDGVVTSAKIVDGSVTPADTQVGALPSMVIVNTANGYGSTNTLIRRFTNVVTNQGSDITYADSATLGASFTINTNGVYSINFNDCNSAVGTTGISLNSSQLTTSVLTIPVINRLAYSAIGSANWNVCLSSLRYFSAGDIIRVHMDTAIASGSFANIFTITRVA